MQASETELDRINSDVNGSSTESTASGSDEYDGEARAADRAPPDEAGEVPPEGPQEVPCAGGPEAEPLNSTTLPDAPSSPRLPPPVEVTLADEAGARQFLGGPSPTSPPPPARKRTHSFSPEVDPFVLWYRETTAVRTQFSLCALDTSVRY